jgi:D-alanine-D-alanine ligase
MTSERLRIAVLMGGQSAERDVSLRTGSTVVRELSGRHRVKPVEIRPDGRWVVPDGFVGETLGVPLGGCFAGDGLPLPQALAILIQERVDVVFNGLHGPMGEDGTVQGLFRMAGIPLTGPDVVPAAVSMDKRLTKQVLISSGVPTPRFFWLRASYLENPPPDALTHLRLEAERCPLPWILKPTRLGSSVGVAIYEDLDTLLLEAPKLLGLWPPTALRESVLVEEVVLGRELTCGVIETSGPPRALPPVEIRPRARRFFDFHAKYVPGASEEICPAPLDPAERALVEQTALRVHEILECAPLSRTDMFLTPGGGMQVLEVNTLPGMTETSLIPLSVAEAGIALGDLLSEIVQHAIRRERGRGGAAAGGIPG